MSTRTPRSPNEFHPDDAVADEPIGGATLRSGESLAVGVRWRARGWTLVLDVRRLDALGRCTSRRIGELAPHEARALVHALREADRRATADLAALERDPRPPARRGRRAKGSG